MSCQGKPFVNSHTLIRFTLGSGVVMANIQDLTATLTLRGESVSKSLVGGGVAVDGADYLMTIESTDLSINGNYNLEVVALDINGDIKRICPTPSTVEFLK